MKRYIKSSTGRQTLREYLEDNRDRLQGQNLVIADLTPYSSVDPTYNSNDEDCPGVLFDGTIDEVLNSDPDNFENNTSMDNFLDQTDLDRCFVKSTKAYPNGEEILIGGFFK